MIQTDEFVHLSLTAGTHDSLKTYIMPIAEVNMFVYLARPFRPRNTARAHDGHLAFILRIARLAGD